MIRGLQCIVIPFTIHDKCILAIILLYNVKHHTCTSAAEYNKTHNMMILLVFRNHNTAHTNTGGEWIHNNIYTHNIKHTLSWLSEWVGDSLVEWLWREMMPHFICREREGEREREREREIYIMTLILPNILVYAMTVWKSQHITRSSSSQRVHTHTHTHAQNQLMATAKL